MSCFTAPASVPRTALPNHISVSSMVLPNMSMHTNLRVQRRPRREAAPQTGTPSAPKARDGPYDSSNQIGMAQPSVSVGSPDMRSITSPGTATKMAAPQHEEQPGDKRPFVVDRTSASSLDTFYTAMFSGEQIEASFQRPQVPEERIRGRVKRARTFRRWIPILCRMKCSVGNEIRRFEASKHRR